MNSVELQSMVAWCKEAVFGQTSFPHETFMTTLSQKQKRICKQFSSLMFNYTYFSTNSECFKYSITGDCQRPVFSLGVSQHMHKITNLWKFELNWSSKKNTLVKRRCVLSDDWFRDLKIYFWGLGIKFVENEFFLKNYVTSDGAVSHSVLDY